MTERQEGDVSDDSINDPDGCICRGGKLVSKRWERVSKEAKEHRKGNGEKNNYGGVCTRQLRTQYNKGRVKGRETTFNALRVTFLVDCKLLVYFTPK